MRPIGGLTPRCGVTSLLLLVAAAPAVLLVPLDGRPVRFGAPVPAAAVQRGLCLDGPGSLQWRRLPIGRPDVDPVWVEIAISGPPGLARVIVGDGPPCPDGAGAVFVRDVQHELLPHGRLARTTWRWLDGTADRVERLTFTAPTELDGERYTAGEHRTDADASFAARADVVLRLGRAWFADIGLLPPHGGGGDTTRQVRRQLAAALPGLRELPGRRGAGDYLRSGEVVTNLEFDTTLALVRAAVGLRDAGAWQRARRSARHLLDRDLDARTGLPFPHGLDHRTGQPEPGHAWLQGLLWVGLLTADDELLQAAVSLAAALAVHPPVGTGRDERLRDHAWPLYELEALLAIAPDPVLARAADRLAASILRRFDATHGTFRFGEGEVGERVYLERGWLVGGVLLPALRAHGARNGNVRVLEAVAQVEQALLERIGRGGQGLPTHWRLANGRAFAEHRAEGTAEAALLLEGLSGDALARLLRRGSVRSAVAEVPRLDDPDLATQFTMLARCTWVWR